MIGLAIVVGGFYAIYHAICGSDKEKQTPPAAAAIAQAQNTFQPKQTIAQLYQQCRKAAKRNKHQAQLCDANQKNLLQFHTHTVADAKKKHIDTRRSAARQLAQCRGLQQKAEALQLSEWLKKEAVWWAAVERKIAGKSENVRWEPPPLPASCDPPTLLMAVAAPGVPANQQASLERSFLRAMRAVPPAYVLGIATASGIISDKRRQTSKLLPLLRDPADLETLLSRVTEFGRVTPRLHAIVYSKTSPAVTNQLTERLRAAALGKVSLCFFTQTGNIDPALQDLVAGTVEVVAVEQLPTVVRNALTTDHEHNRFRRVIQLQEQETLRLQKQREEEQKKAAELASEAAAAATAERQGVSTAYLIGGSGAIVVVLAIGVLLTVRARRRRRTAQPSASTSRPVEASAQTSPIVASRSTSTSTTTATTPALATADAKPIARAEPSTTSTLADISEAARTPFSNLVNALWKHDAATVAYWRKEVLALKSHDAHEYVTRVIDVILGGGTIYHFKRMRGGITEELFPAKLWSAFETAVGAVEWFFLNKSRPAFLRFEVPDDCETPDNPLDRADDLLEYVKKRTDDEDDRAALVEIAREKHFETAHRYFVLTVGAREDTECVVPINFQDLSIMLAILSKWEAKNGALHRRLSRLATLCAAVVSPSDIEYADVANAFAFSALKLPQHAPLETEESIAMVVSGEGRLTVATPSAFAESADSSASDETPPPTEEDLLRGVKRSLFGLVATESFATLLAMDIYEFLRTRQSRGRLFWGPSGVGKTEVAQRLAGLRQGIAPLRLGGDGEVRYISGVDGKLEIKEIVDQLAPMSVLFVDEADKCLDSKAGMVTSAEATQVCHAIVTHFQRKPILWVFIGVFAQMRGDGPITDDGLRSTIGNELAHRLDYADWRFEGWTLENLLKAVGHSRAGVDCEDEAALILAQYCVASGGGVRAYDNLVTAILRQHRAANKAIDRITVDMVRSALAQRGVHV